uniref:Predicted protein n=1 Tax=Hordeum vulgare subsp. vulgare TaxID=112509 RepID=F2EHL8_HORVV|nr:predicted protein [Hordeum vulgare subsp. vulgare]
MAPAKDDAADGEEKSVFRCLDAVRYVVAAVVTVLIVTVIVYAITVVFRPGNLHLGVVGGSVSVSTSGGERLRRPFNASFHGDNLTFSFTVRAFNPSGRVSIYYRAITAMLKSNLSSSPFLYLKLPDMALGPQVMVDTNLLMNTFVQDTDQAYYFNLLGNGSSIDDVLIVLNGSRFDEVNSGHYTNVKEPDVYYCSHITVGGDKEDDGTAADVRCKDENQLGSS